jgi:uncharacterized protein YqeY
VFDPVSALTDRLRADLTTAMKARDAVRTGTLRMALTAVHEEEVAGKEARELNDEQVMTVLTREARKRREAAEAFAGAGREELAAKERAEEQVLAEYLPAQLGDDEWAELVDRVLAAGDFSGPKAMGPAMKAVNAALAAGAGSAEGGRVAASVRRQLG